LTFILWILILEGTEITQKELQKKEFHLEIVKSRNTNKTVLSKDQYEQKNDSLSFIFKHHDARKQLQS